jgi:hypothetical protein
VGKEKEMKNFIFAFNRELRTLIDLRTDEDRHHYYACAYDDEHGKEIDRFLSSSWSEEENEDLGVITFLEDKIAKDLWHFEHDRPNTIRYKPLAARGKGAIVEILYYCYEDDYSRNGRRPWYSVIRKIQLNPYVPISERTKLVLRFWEKGEDRSSNFEIGINSQMPIEFQVLKYAEKYFKLFKFDCCTHIDVCSEDRKTKIFTVKHYEDGKFYISQIY